MISRPKDLLAFVHVHKAAGTTINHILRRNYFLRYLDVRPYHLQSRGVFSAADMKTALRINPGIRCISGHSVCAYSDLPDLIPHVTYVTLLRDPIKRFVSHYVYVQDWRNRGKTFEEFAANEFHVNYMTKRIAGCLDVDAAKQILKDRFAVVGFVEEFDEFLLVLANKLRPKSFQPMYQKQNIAPTKNQVRNMSAEEVMSRYHDQLVELNALDIELYNFARDELLPRQRQEYGEGLTNDVEEFRRQQASAGQPTMLSYLDFIIRKAYYEPVTGLVRLKNGLSYRGERLLRGEKI